MDEQRKQSSGKSEKPSRNSPESAACHVRGGDVATPTHDEGYGERQRRNAREEGRLRLWAEQKGKLGGTVPENKFDGGEHRVDFDVKTQRFIKATRADVGFGYGTYLSSSGQQATPSEYLDRIALHNRIFDDDIRVERVVLQRGGAFSIVISQRRVDGDPALEAQINETMDSKGFEPFGDGIYYNADKGLLIHDMHPRNAVFSQGRTVPIDTSIQRVTPEFAAWVRANKEILKNQGMLR